MIEKLKPEHWESRETFIAFIKASNNRLIDAYHKRIFKHKKISVKDMLIFDMSVKASEMESFQDKLLDTEIAILFRRYMNSIEDINTAFNINYDFDDSQLLMILITYIKEWENHPEPLKTRRLFCANKTPALLYTFNYYDFTVDWISKIYEKNQRQWRPLFNKHRISWFNRNPLCEPYPPDIYTTRTDEGLIIHNGSLLGYGEVDIELKIEKYWRNKW